MLEKSPLGETRNRKAQQEMIGFVVIVVLVSIIGMVFVFLLISRADNKENGNPEAASLLESLMHYTTECAINYIPQYKDGEGLINSCYNNELCLNQKEACVVANQTFTYLLKTSLDINPSNKNKAFNLNAYYTSNSSNEAIPILYINDGKFNNCSSIIGANRFIVISQDSGIINVELEICNG